MCWNRPLCCWKCCMIMVEFLLLNCIMSVSRSPSSSCCHDARDQFKSQWILLLLSKPDVWSWSKGVLMFFLAERALRRTVVLHLVPARHLRMFSLFLGQDPHQPSQFPKVNPRFYSIIPSSIGWSCSLTYSWSWFWRDDTFGFLTWYGRTCQLC
jgi:hypothetical protein